MHSMQRIEATSYTGSRLSTHFSSGKTASISNRKMYINNAQNHQQHVVSRINNNRHEETVASRFQLKREQDLKSIVVERIGSEKVRFSRSRRVVLRAFVKGVVFFSHRNNPQHKQLYLLNTNTKFVFFLTIITNTERSSFTNPSGEHSRLVRPVEVRRHGCCGRRRRRETGDVDGDFVRRRRVEQRSNPTAGEGPFVGYSAVFNPYDGLHRFHQRRV